MKVKKHFICSVDIEFDTYDLETAKEILRLEMGDLSKRYIWSIVDITEINVQYGKNFKTI